MWRTLIDFLSSLKLTLACLALAIVLVLAGTLAQVHYGLDTVQERYFRSILVWWPPDASSFKFPVFPGGHLIGAFLLINLITAHIRRFQWTWKKVGIQLTHSGLIIMLAGGLFTDLLSVESFLRLTPGETKNYSEDSRAVELAITDLSDNDLETVTTIPQRLLGRGGMIQHESIPFRVLVRHFYRNSEIRMLAADAKLPPAASRGVGTRMNVVELPPAAAMNASNMVSTVVEILPQPLAGQATSESLGTFLVSNGLGAPQEFECAGRKWNLALRAVRYYKPYSLTLRKFTHERYMGTDIPKNFASKVVLIDPDRSENREVLIYMNHPLRYRGDTYYQASFEKGDTATILQVVNNPSFATPYVACIIVGAGLLFQFGYHFLGFTRRQRKTL